MDGIFKMSRRKTFTPSEWVIQTIQKLNNGPNLGKNIHFDIFKDYANPKGLALLTYACHVLIEARTSAKLMANEQKYFKPYIYIHLGYDESVQYWDNSIWMKLGQDNKEITYQPPSLGIASSSTSGNHFFGIDLEEYRCPLKFPLNFSLDEKNNISALYRCFRDENDIENNWEFSRGIYLFHKEDF